jgi:hypothetical protein
VTGRRSGNTLLHLRATVHAHPRRSVDDGCTPRRKPYPAPIPAKEFDMHPQSTLRFATLAAVCVIALGMSQPSSAAAWRGSHRNGVTGDHVVAGQGANGGRGIHAGGTVGDGSGGLIHASGGAYSGANGTVWRGSYTHLQSNGGVTHQGAHRINGANGGYDNGHNSFSRNPDGSSQASWQNSGRGANGGSIYSSGNFSRGSDGTLAGSSQTSASGTRGNYNGSTTAANGTTTHDSDYKAANGDSYQGESSYTKGQGYTHSGTCKDAQGNVIQCH